MPITKATASSVAPAAKGDLVVGSATNDAAILGVGTNNQVLTADSAEATGLKWATASSGGMTLLSTTTLSGASTTVSAISGSYKNLQIMIQGFYSSASQLNIRFNSDSGANYGRYYAETGGTGTAGTGLSQISPIEIGTTSAYDRAGVLWATIPRYTESHYKSFVYSAVGYVNSAAQGRFGYFTWNNTSAITSIEFATNGTWSGGTVYIYGVN